MKLVPKAWLIVFLMVVVSTTTFFVSNPAIRIDQFQGHTAIIGRLDLPWGVLLIGLVLVAMAVYGMALNAGTNPQPPTKIKKALAAVELEDD